MFYVPSSHIFYDRLIVEVAPPREKKYIYIYFLSFKQTVKRCQIEPWVNGHSKFLLVSFFGAILEYQATAEELNNCFKPPPA